MAYYNSSAQLIKELISDERQPIAGIMEQEELPVTNTSDRTSVNSSNRFYTTVVLFLPRSLAMKFSVLCSISSRSTPPSQANQSIRHGVTQVAYIQSKSDIEAPRPWPRSAKARAILFLSSVVQGAVGAGRHGPLVVAAAARWQRRRRRHARGRSPPSGAHRPVLMAGAGWKWTCVG